MHRCVSGPLVQKQGAHQGDGLGEGQPCRDIAHDAWQLIAGEEHAAQEHHGGEEQREVVGEEVVAFGQRVEDECDAAEGDAHAQEDGPRGQELPALGDAQRKHHAQDGGDGEQRFEGGPQHLCQQHIVQTHGGVQDAVPCFLHMHAREG